MLILYTVIYSQSSGELSGYIKAQAFSIWALFFDLGLTGSGLGLMISHKMSPRIP